MVWAQRGICCWDALTGECMRCAVRPSHVDTHVQMQCALCAGQRLYSQGGAVNAPMCPPTQERRAAHHVLGGGTTGDADSGRWPHRWVSGAE